MKRILLISVLLAVTLLSACAAPATVPTITLSPTPTITVTPTLTPTATVTPVPTLPPPVTGTTTPSRTPGVALKWSTPPAMTIDQTKTYFATVDTSLGSFKIQLFANETPNTVNNFVFLANQGFYNGVIFHRIIQTFMMQTGDPTGTGGGGPGYSFADELPPKHSYAPGIVAMANAGPNTNGSQFFICTGADSTSLNSSPNYTQFGQVVSGMDIVQKIAAVQVGPGNPGETSHPVNPPVINNITITPQ